MGKRKGGIMGLARFVSDAFKNSNDASSRENRTGEASVDAGVSEDAQTRDSSRISTSETELRPAKKRRVSPGAALEYQRQEAATSWDKRYDATGIVPHYTDVSQVPAHLKKYFMQRFRLFSLYSSPPGCLLDEEGWYSVTPERVAEQIAERCRCDTVLDAFCGVGGNAIAFAKTCQRVIALDTSPTRLALARHNAQIYGVADRIEFILADYVSFARMYLSQPHNVQAHSDPAARKIDVVFLSPPWGGPSYLDGTTDPNTSLINTNENSRDAEADGESNDAHPSYSLTAIQPLPGLELFRLTRRITKNVAFFLPRNTNLEDISELLTKENEIKNMAPVSAGGGDSDADTGSENSNEQEWVEVEEEWMGNKLKALTCYFGGLADGQGEILVSATIFEVVDQIPDGTEAFTLFVVAKSDLFKTKIGVARISLPDPLISTAFLEGSYGGIRSKSRQPKAGRIVIATAYERPYYLTLRSVNVLNSINAFNAIRVEYLFCLLDDIAEVGSY